MCFHVNYYKYAFVNVNCNTNGIITVYEYWSIYINITTRMGDFGVRAAPSPTRSNGMGFILNVRQLFGKS